MHERDERWAYIALAVLVVAYLVYRFAGSFEFAAVSLRTPDLNLGKLGKKLPYLFAPLFAVMSEVIRRRKAKAAREDWERRARTEGLLRGEENLKVRFVEGGRGSIKSDVRLTRVALYLLDRTGRREPMRFLLSPADAHDAAVLDATLLEGSSPELRKVRVAVGASSGEGRFTFEFESREGAAWWSILRRASGRSSRAEPPLEPPIDADTGD